MHLLPAVNTPVDAYVVGARDELDAAITHNIVGLVEEGAFDAFGVFIGADVRFAVAGAEGGVSGSGECESASAQEGENDGGRGVHSG